MGVDSDRVIYESLYEPAVLGPHGEFLVLREDGAIIDVDGGNEKYFSFIYQDRPDVSLIVGSDRINVLYDDGIRCAVDGLDDFIVTTKLLPLYPDAFVIKNKNGNGSIVCNAKNGLRFFKMHSPDVSEVVTNVPIRAYAGWFSGGYVYISGMTPRSRTEEKNAFSLLRGVASIAKLDMNRGEYLVHVPETSLLESVKRELTDSYANSNIENMNLGIESWVGGFSIGDKQLLIGAIIDRRPSESDWRIQEALSWSDYFVTGLFSFERDSLKAIKLLYPYAFVQAVQLTNRSLLYFVNHTDQGVKIRNLYCLVVMDDPIIDEPGGLTFDKLNGDEALGYFSVHSDEKIGFYGVISVLGRHASIVSYMIRSKNGKDWLVVDKLNIKEAI